METEKPHTPEESLTQEDSGGGDNSRAAHKVRSFPHTPGVYLMKDAAGRVIYVGKAKDLRSRAGQLLPQGGGRRPAHGRPGARNPRHRLPGGRERGRCPAHGSPADQGHPAQVQPRSQGRQDLPLLGDPRRRGFPARRVHPRNPAPRGTKLYGPFASAAGLRGAIQVLQKIFKFRTCSLDIQERRRAVAVVSPLPAARHRPMHGALQLPHLQGRIPQGDPPAANNFWKGRSRTLLVEMREEMAAAAKELQFEKAARLRDEIHLLETLDERGELDTHVQPEVFPIDPKKGLAGLQQDPEPARAAAHDRGRGHRPSPAARRPWPAWCSSSTGCPSSRATSDYRIRSVEGVDDFAAIHEVVARRFQRLSEEGEMFPDLLLIDGGKGQLHAALAAFSAINVQPPMVLSLAKREEEVFVMNVEEPAPPGSALVRSPAVAVRARTRPTASPSTTTIS